MTTSKHTPQQSNNITITIFFQPFSISLNSRLKIPNTDDHKQAYTTTVKQYHDIFSAILHQSKFNISNYELMKKVCIVFFSCVYIKARQSMCNFL